MGWFWKKLLVWPYNQLTVHGPSGWVAAANCRPYGERNAKIANEIMAGVESVLIYLCQCRVDIGIDSVRDTWRLEPAINRYRVHWNLPVTWLIWHGITFPSSVLTDTASDCLWNTPFACLTLYRQIHLAAPLYVMAVGVDIGRGHTILTWRKDSVSPPLPAILREAFEPLVRRTGSDSWELSVKMWAMYIYYYYYSVAWVRERTIPTERPPPVGEVSANFCG
jgi:hypothetical protein